MPLITKIYGNKQFSTTSLLTAFDIIVNEHRATKKGAITRLIKYSRILAIVSS